MNRQITLNIYRITFLNYQYARYSLLTQHGPLREFETAKPNHRNGRRR